MLHRHVLLLSSILFFGLPASADAQTLLLDLGSGFTPSSTVKGYEKYFGVGSMSLGATRGAYHGGLELGPVELSGLSLTKAVDANSPKLFHQAVTGASLPTATLVMLDSAGKMIFALKLKDVIITNYQVGAAGGGGGAHESFTLHFVQVQYEAAAATTPLPSACWNVAEGNTTCQ